MSATWLCIQLAFDGPDQSFVDDRVLANVRPEVGPGLFLAGSNLPSPAAVRSRANRDIKTDRLVGH